MLHFFTLFQKERLIGKILVDDVHNTYQRNYLEDEQRLFTKADED